MEFCIPKMKEGFMPIDKTEYNPTIDVMNIAACIAVVALHVNGGIWSFTRNLNWAIMLITECVCYGAVPVFFMITGATLLDYRLRYSTKVFFKSALPKQVYRSSFGVSCQSFGQCTYRIICRQMC